MESTQSSSSSGVGVVWTSFSSLPRFVRLLLFGGVSLSVIWFGVRVYVMAKQIQALRKTANHLPPVSSLRNRYILYRHGHSSANQQSIISSDPVVATVQHGLTERGKQQVAESLPLFHPLTQTSPAHKSSINTNSSSTSLSSSPPSICTSASSSAVCYPLLDHRPISLICSDFLRAIQTAQILKERLRLRDSSVTIDIRLRERSFGKYNGLHDNYYQQVWAYDAIDSAHTKNGVESVLCVLDRTTALIADCEAKRAGETIILVAHGDVLQILRTAFAGIDAGKHRSLEHIQNARPVLLNEIGSGQNNANAANANGNANGNCCAAVPEAATEKKRAQGN